MAQKNKSRKRKNPTIEISCDPQVDGILNIIEGPWDNAISLQLNSNQRKISTKEVSGKECGDYKYTTENLHLQPQTLVNFRNNLKDIKHQMSSICKNLKNFTNKCHNHDLENTNQQKKEQYYQEPTQKNSSDKIMKKRKRLTNEYPTIMIEDKRKFCEDHSGILEDHNENSHGEQQKVPHKQKCIACNENYPRSSHVKNYRSSLIKRHKFPQSHRCKKSHVNHCGLYADNYRAQQTDYHETEYPHKSTSYKHLFSRHDDITLDQGYAVEHMEAEYYTMVKDLKTIMSTGYNTGESNIYKEHEFPHTSHQVQQFAEDIEKDITKSNKPFKELPYNEKKLCKYEEIIEKLQQIIFLNQKDKLKKNDEQGKKFSHYEKLFCKLKEDIDKLQQQIDDEKDRVSKKKSGSKENQFNKKGTESIIDQLKKSKTSSKKKQLRNKTGSIVIIKSDEYLKDFPGYEKLLYHHKKEAEKLQEQRNLNKEKEEDEKYLTLDRENEKRVQLESKESDSKEKQLKIHETDPKKDMGIKILEIDNDDRFRSNAKSKQSFSPVNIYFKEDVENATDEKKHKTIDRNDGKYATLESISDDKPLLDTYPKVLNHKDKRKSKTLEEFKNYLMKKDPLGKEKFQYAYSTQLITTRPHQEIDPAVKDLQRKIMKYIEKESDNLLDEQFSISVDVQISKPYLSETSLRDKSVPENVIMMDTDDENFATLKSLSYGERSSDSHPEVSNSEQKEKSKTFEEFKNSLMKKDPSLSFSIKEPVLKSYIPPTNIFYKSGSPNDVYDGKHRTSDKDPGKLATLDLIPDDDDKHPSGLYPKTSSHEEKSKTFEEFKSFLIEKDPLEETKVQYANLLKYITTRPHQKIDPEIMNLQKQLMVYMFHEKHKVSDEASRDEFSFSNKELMLKSRISPKSIFYKSGPESVMDMRQDADDESFATLELISTDELLSDSNAKISDSEQKDKSKTYEEFKNFSMKKDSSVSFSIKEPLLKPYISSTNIFSKSVSLNEIDDEKHRTLDKNARKLTLDPIFNNKHPSDLYPKVSSYLEKTKTFEEFKNSLIKKDSLAEAKLQYADVFKYITTRPHQDVDPEIMNLQKQLMAYMLHEKQKNKVADVACRDEFSFSIKESFLKPRISPTNIFYKSGSLNDVDDDTSRTSGAGKSATLDLISDDKYPSVLYPTVSSHEEKTKTSEELKNSLAEKDSLEEAKVQYADLTKYITTRPHQEIDPEIINLQKQLMEYIKNKNTEAIDEDNQDEFSFTVKEDISKPSFSIEDILLKSRSLNNKDDKKYEMLDPDDGLFDTLESMSEEELHQTHD